MTPLAAMLARHRLAPDPREGRICARPGGAGRAQAGSPANRQGGEIGHSAVPDLIRDLSRADMRPRLGGRGCGGAR